MMFDFLHPSFNRKLDSFAVDLLEALYSNHWTNIRGKPINPLCVFILWRCQSDALQCICSIRVERVSSRAHTHTHMRSNILTISRAYQQSYKHKSCSKNNEPIMRSASTNPFQPAFIALANCTQQTEKNIVIGCESADRMDSLYAAGPKE